MYEIYEGQKPKKKKKGTWRASKTDRFKAVVKKRKLCSLE